MGPAIGLESTEACVFVDCTEMQRALIRDVFAENRETLALLGPLEAPEELAGRLIAAPDLPPGGSVAYTRNAVIQCRATQVGLGVLELYRGYPDAQTLYIGGLFLRPAWQGRGLGSEIVAALKRSARAAGYQRLGAAVGLKNWPALRFWIAAGFTQIGHVRGDAAYGPERFANLGLLYDL